MADTSLDAIWTLPGRLRYWATHKPDRLAFRNKKLGIWERITFRDYYRATLEFAGGLRALGVGKGDFVAVASDNSPEWLYSDLAIQSLGGACIGVYPTNPWRELRYILEHSKASIVVCGDQEQVDKVLDAIKHEGPLQHLKMIICVDMKGLRNYPRDMLLSFDEVRAMGRAREAEFTPIIEREIDGLAPDETGVIVYTSGTTGLPKGAMLTHYGLLRNAQAITRRHGLDRIPLEVVCYLPLCHVAERVSSTALQMYNGNTVSFAESIDTVMQDLREIAPTYLLAVPRIWEKMLNSIAIRQKEATPLQRGMLERILPVALAIAKRRQANGGQFASVRDRLLFCSFWVLCFRSLQKYLGLNRGRTLLCGGATVSPDLLDFFWSIGLKLYQVYGMTETSGFSHSQVWGFTGSGLSGPPLEDVEHRIAEDGEILLKSPAVFKGYLYDEAASRNAFSEGWLKTGDVGEIRAQNTVAVTDRKKDIIITSGGKNITPSLIENRAKDSPYIRECVLIGERRNYLTALIQIDLETVGKWAQERGLAYTNFRSLSERPEVRELIGIEIGKVNSEFARVENIRKFELFNKALDHDDGEVTATMKVRRSVIEKKFKDLVDKMYTS